MSETTVPYPIVGAVKGAEQILGPNLKWSGKNELQLRFLSQYFEVCKDETARIKDIETLASLSADDINVFLAKKGFSIKLDPFRPGEFGVACVLDVLVKWLVAGSKRPLHTAHGTFPGAYLRNGLDFLMSPLHGEAIVRLKTLSGDRVCLTMMDNPPVGFDIESGVRELSATATHRPVAYDAVHFPMVDLNQKVDISWLIGMSAPANGMTYEVSQAKQQTKLRMNHIGARAQSGVAVGIMPTSVRLPPPDLIINRPFLVWFERDGLHRTLFSGHITPDDWKEPADLDTP